MLLLFECNVDGLQCISTVVGRNRQWRHFDTNHSELSFTSFHMNNEMYFICSHNVVNHNFHCMAMCCCWMHLVLVFFLCVWICCAFYTFRNIMCSNVSAILFTCSRRCLSNAVKQTKNTWTAVICYFVFILPCHFRMAERNSFKRIEIEYSLHVILICHIIVIPLNWSLAIKSCFIEKWWRQSTQHRQRMEK